MGCGRELVLEPSKGAGTDEAERRGIMGFEGRFEFCKSGDCELLFLLLLLDFGF